MPQATPAFKQQAKGLEENDRSMEGRTIPMPTNYELRVRHSLWHDGLVYLGLVRLRNPIPDCLCKYVKVDVLQCFELDAIACYIGLANGCSKELG